jgi:signal transduction histidine kinase
MLFTEPHHSIAIGASAGGIGIAKGNLEKIFDMYGRVQQDVEGHGIGLYLAKKIVDAAHRNIIVESELGKGSKFIIYLKVQ